MKNLTSKKWWGAATERAIRTAAQTAGALILANTATANLWTIDWKLVIGVAGAAAFLSMLTSIKGLPEVKEKR